ncbi:MAG TPA: DUF309 domain-containing protein [Cyanothece sp. UBA12306]|nr:DUF309 domain-containing protein [Cyanothece sp. UBA12306]
MSSASFWQAIEQFNHQQFYDCHDTLEALWMEAIEPDKQFYQGILQIAVGCYHLGNHNWHGAVMLLGEGIRRLSDYQPDYQEIDVDHLIEKSQQLLRHLQGTEPQQVNKVVEQMKTTSDNSACCFPQIIKI